MPYECILLPGNLKPNLAQYPRPRPYSEGTAQRELLASSKPKRYESRMMQPGSGQPVMSLNCSEVAAFPKIIALPNEPSYFSSADLSGVGLPTPGQEGPGRRGEEGLVPGDPAQRGLTIGGMESRTYSQAILRSSSWVQGALTQQPERDAFTTADPAQVLPSLGVWGARGGL